MVCPWKKRLCFTKVWMSLVHRLSQILVRRSVRLQRPSWKKDQRWIIYCKTGIFNDRLISRYIGGHTVSQQENYWRKLLVKISCTRKFPVLQYFACCSGPEARPEGMVSIFPDWAFWNRWTLDLCFGSGNAGLLTEISGNLGPKTHKIWCIHVLILDLCVLRLGILDSSDKSTCTIPKKTHVTPCRRGDLGGQPRVYPGPACDPGRTRVGPTKLGCPGPPGWTPKVAPFDLMGHKLDPGTPWVTPKVTPFDIFGLYHLRVWVYYMWTCLLNPKSWGLKHTSPKWDK